MLSYKKDGHCPPIQSHHSGTLCHLSSRRGKKAPIEGSCRRSRLRGGKYEKAKFSDVFKYSFGGLGSNLAFFLVMAFLTFFYTDIFGISSYVVATLMLISRFIDAFTDPIMGMLGDNTRSKMGKYRPWIIFGAPVLGVLIFLLFTDIPHSLNHLTIF